MAKNKGFLILIGVLVIIAIFLFTTFNKMVNKDEKMILQWNEVQNAYQRRLDLIPNLVNTVKGGADYEKEVLTQVTEARSEAIKSSTSQISAESYNQQANAHNNLASAANRLLIVVEKYPDLKGTRAFRDLQTQLEGTERRIKVARKDFNDAVADYNATVRRFPGNIVAGLFGFPPKEGFQADSGAEKSVEIKF